MDKLSIPFNKPYLTSKETHYIYDAVHTEGKLSGNGKYTQLCQSFFEERYGFGKCLLTTSCTDALEMSAILLGIQPGDEVIMPSYTFVSTANAFVLRGATIRFADTYASHPNISPESIAELITPKTKAIVVVHYAGVACDMDAIMALAEQHGVFVVEDAAQAIDSYCQGKPLGSIGHLAAFSFHETKNIIAGEGGMLVVNDKRFAARAEIIWEKGTNRAAFFRGEVAKYEWVDVGSSFLPSETTAAFLYAQLEHLDDIQSARKKHWARYEQIFSASSSLFGLPIEKPFIPDYATNNANMYYVLVESRAARDGIITKLGDMGILAVFHYRPLHSSPYFADKHDDGRALPHTERFTQCLLRLPMYVELDERVFDCVS